MRRSWALPAVLLLASMACAGGEASVTSVEEADVTAAPSTTTTVATTTTMATTSTAVAADTTSTSQITVTATTAEPETRVMTATRPVPFTMTVPADWTANPDFTSDEVLAIATSSITDLIAITTERGSVTEWRDFLFGNPQIDATEPKDIEVGGAPGFTSDLRIGEAATDAGCVATSRCVELTGSWLLFEDFPNRVWVVDVDGQAVAFFAEAPEGSLESLAGKMEEALTTLEWGDGGT